MGKSSFVDAVVTGYRRGTPVADAHIIARATCKAHGITLDELRGNSRLSRYVRARRDAIAEMKKRGLSLHQIGQAMARDHSTIQHHLRFLGLTSCVDKS